MKGSSAHKKHTRPRGARRLRALRAAVLLCALLLSGVSQAHALYHLTWDKNRPSDGVTHYILYWKKVSDDSWNTKEVGIDDACNETATTCSCQLNHPDDPGYPLPHEPEGTYIFSLRARNASEDSTSALSEQISYTFGSGSTTSSAQTTTSTVPSGATTVTSSAPASTTTVAADESSAGGDETSSGSGSSSGGSSSGGGSGTTTSLYQLTTTTSAVITTSSTVPATTTVSEEEAEADADGDGIADDLEAVYGTDPALADTDNDGLSDGDELGFWGTRFDDDPDRDGLVNIRDFDSDNDGFPDGLELSQNADPADGGSFPAVMQQILAGQGGSADESGAIRVFDAQNVVTEHMHARSRDESLTLSGKDVASLFMIHVSWPEYNEASGEVRIASGDIDGDNKDEIIVGLGPVDGEPDLPGGRFAVYDDNYACMLWGTIGWPEYNALNGESWPACGDIDADGSDEIFIGLGDGGAGKIEVFDFVGSKLRHRTWITTGWAEYEEAIGEARPACGNIDLDRADELIIGLGPVAGTSGLEGGLFEVLDNDLAVLEWGKVVWDEYNDMNGETRPACGDIDVDLRDEIIIGLGEGGDGRLVAFDYTPDDIREKQWMRIGWDEYSYSYGETRPAAGNIDFDFNDEIIVGLGPGGDGWIEAFDGAVNRYEPIMRVQLVSMDDTLQSGALWPAVKGISARNVLFRRMLKNMMHTMFTRR